MDKKQKIDYRPLKRDLFFKMVVVLGVSAVVLFFTFAVIYGGWGGVLARIYMRIFKTDEQSTLVTIARNLVNYFGDFIVFGMFLLCIFVMFKVVVNWNMKYFEEIGRGVDKLIHGDESYIELPYALNFMESKLNKINTTLQTRERETKEAQKQKDDLVMYLAHDIKTPLTSIIGYLNLLEEIPEMPLEQRAKYVGVTLEKAYRLEELINQFFEITRFNYSQIILQKSNVDLHYMLIQLAEEFYPITVKDNKTIEIDCPETVEVIADSDKLARVFNNVLKNAVTYSDPDSQIHIRVEELANNVQIVFENQGAEIPQLKLNAIFDKFYRLDSARSTNTGGSGLGLAIAKDIVEAHGGEITAQSEGKRTRFIVTIPKDIPVLELP